MSRPPRRCRARPGERGDPAVTAVDAASEKLVARP
ncbi:hypothetical protein J2S44_007531 [Catenuloplanes niger]|uniref:Uncharacterized protein n=1 Tax=Catenuloplanes niger TaxID=587534 RepID=A0AAE4CVE9_9ACTN|nr:hypothetical protein [Catenuloplanes niger]